MASAYEGSHDATGGTVGGQVGYRWQMSSRVFGLEAQGNWADFTGNNSSLIFAGTKQPHQDRCFGLFTGQIGYAVDRALLYVNGGAAVIDNKYTSITTGARRRDRHCHRNPLGRALGAGFEYGFAPSWSLGFQYDHLFLGNNDFVSDAGFIADNIKQDVDLFTARMNYRFGGPVVARY